MKSLLILSILLIAGCQTEQTIVAPPPFPNLAPINANLLNDCKLPVKMPSKDMSQQEVENWWTKDRQALIDCAKRHKGLVDVTKFRDEQLTNPEKK